MAGAKRLRARCTAGFTAKLLLLVSYVSLGIIESILGFAPLFALSTGQTNLRNRQQPPRAYR